MSATENPDLAGAPLTTFISAILISGGVLLRIFTAQYKNRCFNLRIPERFLQILIQFLQVWTAVDSAHGALESRIRFGHD